MKIYKSPKYDEKHVVPTPLSGIRVGGRRYKSPKRDLQ
jgi:hypothetical protein